MDMREPYKIVRWTLTKDRAKDILRESNYGNRTIRPALVQKYKRDMNAGRWASRLATNVIIFSPEARLQDGQHRLTAFVASDLETLGFYVQLDVPDTQRATINAGVSNSLTDFGYPKTVCEVANAMRYAGGLLGTAFPTINNTTRAEHFEYIDKHREAIDFANRCFDQTPTMRSRVKAAGVRAAFARAWFHYPPEVLQRAARVLVSGIPINPSDGLLIQLSDALLTVQGGGGGQQKTSYTKASRALKASIEGETITRLHGTTVELFPLPTDCVNKRG